MEKEYFIEIIKSDSFVDMSYGAQSLYFQLFNMQKDGQTKNVKSLLRYFMHDIEDLKELLDKNLIMSMKLDKEEPENISSICFSKRLLFSETISGEK